MGLIEVMRREVAREWRAEFGEMGRDEDRQKAGGEVNGAGERGEKDQTGKGPASGVKLVDTPREQEVGIKGVGAGGGDRGAVRGGTRGGGRL